MLAAEASVIRQTAPAILAKLAQTVEAAQGGFKPHTPLQLQTGSLTYRFVS